MLLPNTLRTSQQGTATKQLNRAIVQWGRKGLAVVHFEAAFHRDGVFKYRNMKFIFSPKAFQGIRCYYKLQVTTNSDKQGSSLPMQFLCIHLVMCRLDASLHQLLTA